MLIILQNNMKEDTETNLANNLVWGFVPPRDLRYVRLRTEPSPFYLRIGMFCYDTFYLRLTGSVCESNSCTYKGNTLESGNGCSKGFDTGY